MKLAPIVFFVFLTIGFTNAIAQGQYRIQVVYQNSLMSKSDSFEFALGNDRATIDWNNRSVYFAGRFSAGQPYSVSQRSGPRTCTFTANNQNGTIANGDVMIGVQCGFPPRVNGTLDVTGIEQGETFIFANEYGNSYYATINKSYQIHNFPIGDNYVFKQTSGPRPCRMTNGTGVVTNTSLAISADCSRSGGNGGGTGGGSGGGTVPPTNSFPAIDLVSRSSDDKIFGTFFETWQPVIGGTGADEGRYVAFVTYTKGLGGGSGKYRQIVWRDRKTGETRVISRSATGEDGNQNSLSPAISADGKSVAFESYATNLVTIDTNGVRDVFVWNYDRNTVTAVSENRGTEADGQCMEPTISADGNLIAFSSNASNLAPGVDGTSTVNVFLRDMRSGAVTLISKNETTGKGGGGSNPSISEDGSRIAFFNYAPLTKEDKNTLWDIYVWDGSPKLKRISKTTSGGEKNQGDESSSRVVAPSISGNGRYVAFATTATNMAPGDGNGLQDVFVAEVDSGRVVWASSVDGNTAGDGDSPFGQGEKIAISYDGNLVAFSSKAKNLGGNIVVKNLSTNRITPVSTDVTSTIGQPSMSRNGYYVIFGSNRQLDTRFKSSGTFVVYRSTP